MSKSAPFRPGVCALAVLVLWLPMAYAQELKHTFLLRDTSFSANPELAAPGDNTIFVVNEITELAETGSDRLEVLLAGASLVDAFTYGEDIGGNNDHSFFLFSISRHPLGGTGGAPRTPLFSEPPTEAESDLLWIQDWPQPARLLDIHFKAGDENNASPVPWNGFFDVAKHLGLTGTYGAPRMAPPLVSNVAAFDYFDVEDFMDLDCYFSVNSTVTIGMITIRPADIAHLDDLGVLSIFKTAEELALDGSSDDINALAMNLTGIGIPTGNKLGWFSLTRDSVSLDLGLSSADIFQFDPDIDYTAQALPGLVQMTAESLGLLSRFSAVTAQDADIDGLSHLDPESMVACGFQIDLGGSLDLECENALDGGFAVTVNGNPVAAAQGNQVGVPLPTFADGDYAAVVVRGRQGRRPGTVDEFLARSIGGEIVRVPSLVPPIDNLQSATGTGDEIFWEWTNPDPNPYDFVEVRLDDGPPLVLPSVASEFQTGDLPPGVHFLEVRGVSLSPDEVRSESVFGLGYLEPPGPELDIRQPPESLEVTVSGQDVFLNWTNPVPYFELELELDGLLVTLPDPTTESFVFSGVPFGIHTIRLRGFTPGSPLPTAPSSVEVVIPVPVPGEVLQAFPFAGDNASGVAVHADFGLVLIADRDTGQTFVYQLADLSQPPGNIMSPGNPGSTVTGVAVDEQNDLLLWAVDDQLIVTDFAGVPLPGTGGPLYFDPSSSARDLTFDGGAVWVADVLQGQFTQHDPFTGEFTGVTLPHPQGGGSVSAISWREDGAFEVSASPVFPTDLQWSLDPVGTPLASFPIPGGAQGMAFTLQGSRGVPSIVYVDPAGQIIEVAAVAPLVPPEAVDCHRLPTESLVGIDFPPTVYSGELESSIVVSGTNALVADVDVQLSIQHPFASEVQAILTSPQGTAVTIYDGSAGFVEVIERRIDDLGTGGFNDRFGTRASDGAELATFDGEPVNGTWSLTIEHQLGTNGELLYARASICTLPDVGVPFIRGDADGDGVFNGIVDGLRVLNFAFVPGTPAPPCLDAADADDDNVVNGVLDGLRILNFAFVAGSPPPAPPFPGCGTDTTPGGPGCGSPSDGCP